MRIAQVNAGVGCITVLLVHFHRFKGRQPLFKLSDLFSGLVKTAYNVFVARHLGQIVKGNPAFGRCSTPAAVDDADRHTQFTVQLTGKKVGRSRKRPGIRGGGRLPAALYIIEGHE